MCGVQKVILLLSVEEDICQRARGIGAQDVKLVCGLKFSYITRRQCAKRDVVFFFFGFFLLLSLLFLLIFFVFDLFWLFLYGQLK